LDDAMHLTGSDFWPKFWKLCLSWPPLIKMDAAVKAKVEKLFGGNA
jgi:hypothetical protein